MDEFLDFLKNQKKIWVTVIVIFFAILVAVAIKMGRTPESPFDYRLG